MPNLVRLTLLVACVCFVLVIVQAIGEKFSPTPTAFASKKPLAAQAVHLPLIRRQAIAVPPPVPAATRRVNAPYLTPDIRFSETAVFWFGRVTPSENYADVRVGYTNSELYVYVAAFDKRLWYDTLPTRADLTAWDSVTLYLKLDGNSASAPTLNAYRFDAQLANTEARANYQAAYRGNGSAWTNSATAFTTIPGWRGNWMNDNVDDRGWAMTFRIPFSSLGLSGVPASRSIWGMALALHDRDDAGGTLIADKLWPETTSVNVPSTWGQVAFGLPAFTAPAATPRATVTIRHKLNGATVPDAAVGGYAVCGSGTDFWTQWGNTNESFYNPERTDFNIQNQSDIADWPCFSKYYVTFPLTALPASKAIISATLTLHQTGNADPTVAQPSLIQVLTVDEDWNDTTLTWNTAPLAKENMSTAWVSPISSCQWPCIPRTWNVSGAVAEAYAAGKPLRLVLYTADSNYSSGKYFTSSDTGDWNAEGRPRLDVLWGDP